MKKTLRTILAGALALVAVSCYDDSELRGELTKVKDRLTVIENTINAEVGGINDLANRLETLEGKVAAIKVETDENGVTTLTLSNDSKVVLSKDGVLTIDNGRWATIAADGTITPLGAKLGDAIDFKVEGGELKVSYDGTNYEATGVKISEYTAHVIGNVVKSEDGKSVVLTIGDQTLTLPLVSSAVATLGLSTDNFFLRYGSQKNVTITAANLADLYVMNEPDGWDATIKDNVLTIASPSVKAVNADAADAEGLVLIHATDNNGKCVFAKLEVTTGPGLSLTVESDGKLLLKNAYHGTITSLEGKEYNFLPYYAGVLDVEMYNAILEMGVEEFWAQAGPEGLGGIVMNPQRDYKEGVYEQDVLETTAEELFKEFRGADMPYGSVVFWAAATDDKGELVDGIQFQMYVKYDFNVEVTETLHNDVKIAVTAQGVEGYLIGVADQSVYLSGYKPMTFDEWMLSSVMGGPWVTFTKYGAESALGTIIPAQDFSTDPFTVSQYLMNTAAGKLGFDKSYDLWVMPMFSHLQKFDEQNEMMDYSAYDYDVNFKPYVMTIKTAPLVAAELEEPTLSLVPEYYKVNFTLTPAEKTSVYYAFVESEALLELQDDKAKLDYLVKSRDTNIVSEEQSSYNSMKPGTSVVLLMAVVSEDGKYDVFEKTVETLSLPTVKNESLAVSLSEATKTMSSISVNITPPANTKVYWDYLSDAMVKSMTDETKVIEYLVKKNLIKEAETQVTTSAEVKRLSPNESRTLYVLVIVQDAYNISTQQYTTNDISRNTSLTAELKSLNYASFTTTATFTLGDGVTGVYVHFASGESDYNKANAEKYAATADTSNGVSSEVINGVPTITKARQYSNIMYYVPYNEQDGVRTIGTPVAVSAKTNFPATETK